MKKLLIDYAEVLSKPFPDTAMADLAHRAGIPLSDFRQRYWEHRGPYDCGQPSRDYWQTVLGAGQELDEEELAALVRTDVDGWLDLDPAAVQWLTELNDSGIRPWLLSNAPHPLADAIDDLPIASVFDGMLFSARLGVAKPAQECFAAASSAMEAQPEEILFIDDRSVNTDAAAALGMSTFLFTGSFPTLPSPQAGRPDVLPDTNSTTPHSR